MSVAFVHDRRCRYPTEVAAALGIGTFTAHVPTGVSLGDEGWAVVRETWAGRDVLHPPVTRAQIDALPDPGLDPVEAAALAVADLRAALRSSTTTIDPALVQTAIEHLDAIIGSGTVPDLPDSPTNADVVAQVRVLTVAVNRLADAARDLARFDRAVIRLLA